MALHCVILSHATPHHPVKVAADVSNQQLMNAGGRENPGETGA